MKRALRSPVLPVFLALSLLMGCEAEEEPFPDQIPDIVKSLGEFHEAILARDRGRLNAVSTDGELYDALTFVFGEDSLAVMSRRIKNPIDSAHITMTVKAIDRVAGASNGLYELELFMRKRGEIYWIVAHKLKPYRP